MLDIRDVIFKNIMNEQFTANLIAERDGVLAGAAEAIRLASEIGISLELFINDGGKIQEGSVIGKITADPKSMTMAEEKIIGMLSKYSGIATAARMAVDRAKGRVKVVIGAWKKMPPQLKDGVRNAAICGGASFRISDTPMIYMDKNFIRMLGSIPEALSAAAGFKDYVKVVQIKGRDYSIEEETLQAVENGAHILMVDTGDLNDFKKALAVVDRLEARDKVKIAYAGNVKISQMDDYIKLNIDMLCIGKEIVDAPLLDIRMDVLKKG